MAKLRGGRAELRVETVEQLDQEEKTGSVLNAAQKGWRAWDTLYPVYTLVYACNYSFL